MNDMLPKLCDDECPLVVGGSSVVQPRISPPAFSRLLPHHSTESIQRRGLAGLASRDVVAQTVQTAEWTHMHLTRPPAQSNPPDAETDKNIDITTTTTYR